MRRCANDTYELLQEWTEKFLDFTGGLDIQTQEEAVVFFHILYDAIYATSKFLNIDRTTALDLLSELWESNDKSFESP